MAVKVCEICGREYKGKKCFQCNEKLSKYSPLKNGIKNKKFKEEITKEAMSILISNQLIIGEKDLKHVTFEFGYLFYKTEVKEYVALFKVSTDKRFLVKQKVYYLAIKDKKMFVVSFKFTEDNFRQVSEDMLKRYKIDMSKEDPKDYIWELYY